MTKPHRKNIAPREPLRQQPHGSAHGVPSETKSRVLGTQSLEPKEAQLSRSHARPQSCRISSRTTLHRSHSQRLQPLPRLALPEVRRFGRLLSPEAADNPRELRGLPDQARGGRGCTQRFVVQLGQPQHHIVCAHATSVPVAVHAAEGKVRVLGRERVRGFGVVAWGIGTKSS